MLFLKYKRKRKLVLTRKRKHKRTKRHTLGESCGRHCGVMKDERSTADFLSTQICFVLCAKFVVRILVEKIKN